jgi:hypothetical protein
MGGLSFAAKAATGIRPEETGQHVQQGGFARSVGTNDGDDPGGRESKMHVHQGVEAIEGFGKALTAQHRSFSYR